MEFDIVISGVTIVDGTGRPPYRGSIGISGDRIAAVGEIEPRGEVVIEGEGLVACPGFVDIHAHGDETLFLYPTADSYVRQGVTTIVGGNCGFSPAPLGKWWLMSFWEYDWWHEIEPFKYSPPPLHPLEKVSEKLKEKTGMEIDWRTFGDYLEKVERLGISVNYAPLVGHNTVRIAVMGEDFKREAKPEEVEEMKKLVAEAMESGAIGMSTGLDYVPGCYASTEEVVELAKVVREYGGVHFTHWRSIGAARFEKEFRPPERIKGILEAIEIGERAGVPVQISHVLTGYTVYPPPPPELAEAAARATLRAIEEARERGVDVAFDLIPNTDGGVFAMPRLVSLLSPWLRELGSVERLIENLRIKEFREEVKEAIRSRKWWLLDPLRDPYWAEMIKVVECRIEEYAGKTLGEIARAKGVDPLDALLDLVCEDPDAKIEREIISEEEVLVFLKHPDSMIGADTFALDDKWGMQSPPYFLPHPNTYGLYPRYLRRYVKELGVLSLEEAVRKATYLPAKRVGLEGRGVIKVGAYADLVLLDFERLRDLGDPIEPRKYPEGVEYVIVNGVIVVERGRHTGARPGRVLRRASSS